MRVKTTSRGRTIERIKAYWLRTANKVDQQHYGLTHSVSEASTDRRMTA
jgi:hypothetical protein